MKIEITKWEFRNMLEKSDITNQKTFYKNIINNNLSFNSVFEIITEAQYSETFKQDVRDLINVGALYIDKIQETEAELIDTILENDYTKSEYALFLR